MRTRLTLGKQRHIYGQSVGGGVHWAFWRCRAAGYKGWISKAKLCRTTERQKNLLDCGRWLYKSFWFREQYPVRSSGLLVGLVRTGLTYPLTYCFLWASAVFNIFLFFLSLVSFFLLFFSPPFFFSPLFLSECFLFQPDCLSFDLVKLHIQLHTQHTEENGQGDGNGRARWRWADGQQIGGRGEQQHFNNQD